jgi:hypothetical protein
VVRNACKKKRLNLYALCKKSKFYLFIVLLLTSVSAGSSGYVKEADQLVFTGTAGDSAIVNFLAEIAAERSQELHMFFDGTLDSVVTIRLAASEQEYFQIAGQRIPDWSGGVAFIRRREIILKPGSYFDPEAYRETLIHELVHFYIDDNYESRLLPLWMVEGCAMHLSKPSLTWNEMIILGNAFSNDRIVQFERINDLLKFGPSKAQIAYLQSFSAVRYLVEEFGNDKFRAILQGCSEETDINQNFINQLHIDLSEFEDAWYGAAKHRLRWVLFLQVDNLFWLSLVVVSIAVFIVIRLRNRRIIRHWQETDDFI